MATITRWDPFRDLVSMREDLDRLFGRTPLGGEELARGAEGDWMPAMDIRETPDAFVLDLELPGMDPDAVDVKIDDHSLSISGERRFESESQDGNLHRVERRYGAFRRSVRLPETADVEKVEAAFDKGVLTVTVGKMAEVKPKQIEVKVK
jgi:HSP20 family protein